MKRLDLFLYENRFYNSREKAKQAIIMGRVKVNNVIVYKPAMEVDENAKIDCLPFEFVSRGGFKLQKALEEFKILLKNKVVLDIGASTGGFSDVCLQAGAKKVYCVDTGQGQLAEKILRDKRVVNLEKTNYLGLQKQQFLDVDFVCIDVSFVSLTKFVKKLANDFEHVEIVALIKPQFECGVDYARKHKGVVKDEKVRQKIVENIIVSFKNVGFKRYRIITSPIKGGDGNIEYLLYLKK